ncbi:unnamed protein product [Heligmosomoides polygyrus]|uniref:Uncharacterized protein n=1 Tax=Heligmosomoides polygyrus TaxID=6339 RepID=A0A3P8ENW2_HELPZ|nr:unnamed protein product [Heligmosomoides polygyrus]
MSSSKATASLHSVFLSGVRTADVRCYVCTTIDAAALLKELTDHNWLRWLENVRHAPYSKQCEDDFQVCAIQLFHFHVFSSFNSVVINSYELGYDCLKCPFKNGNSMANILPINIVVLFDFLDTSLKASYVILQFFCQLSLQMCA